MEHERIHQQKNGGWAAPIESGFEIFEDMKERWEESPAETTPGKLIDAAGRGAVEYGKQVDPRIALADRVTDGFLSGASHGGAALFEGMVTGNTDAMQNYTDAALAGDYGVVTQGLAKAGDFIGEHADSLIGARLPDHMMKQLAEWRYQKQKEEQLPAMKAAWARHACEKRERGLEEKLAATVAQRAVDNGNLWALRRQAELAKPKKKRKKHRHRRTAQDHHIARCVFGHYADAPAAEAPAALSSPDEPAPEADPAAAGPALPDQP